MCSDCLNPVAQVGFTNVQLLGSLADTNALAEGNGILLIGGVKSTPCVW
jgi:hypothetical protein